MKSGDIITLVFFAVFFIGPMLMGLLRKKKSPLPKTKEDFERLYRIKTENQKRHDHLKPPPLQPPELLREEVSFTKTEERTDLPIIKEKKTLSSTYKPDYTLSSPITSRHVASEVQGRHVESGIEEMGYRSLLQERFSDEAFDVVQNSSYGKKLLKKTSLKEMVILSELLKRPY